MPKLIKKSLDQRRRENRHQMQRRRLQQSYREQEQLDDTIAHAIVRRDYNRRASEQALRQIRLRRIRKNPMHRRALQALDTARRRVLRKIPIFKFREQLKNTRSHQDKRRTLTRKAQEQERNLASKRRRINLLQTNFDSLKNKYEAEIQEQIDSTCSCCGSLQFKFKMHILKPLEMEKMEKLFLACVTTFSQDPHSFCATCYLAIRNLKIPKLSLSNGLNFPLMPEVLRKLSPLEERLVSPRIPFMQIRPLGCDRQSSLKGNIINVENDLDVCAKVLPRKFTECSTIQVKLKRKLSYNSVYMYETIEPYRVYQAANFLCQSELYKKHKIQLSKEWERSQEGEFYNFICDERDIVDNSTGESDEHDDSDSELVQEEPSKAVTLEAEETFIFDENNMLFHGIVIAPGANKRPISLFLDEDAETLSFPKIYCGVPRKIKPGLKLTYTDIIKSELMRYDRRACVPTKILYSMRKKMNEQISSALRIALRRTHRDNITAQQISEPGFLQNLLNHDEGYTVFKNVRATPAYWQKQCKKVISMIRQLGKCTFFITLSAAETKWTELIIHLMNLSKGKTITEEDVQSLSMEEIRDLIRNDPVTCVNHFHRRYQSFFKYILKPLGGIFAPNQLSDHFSRLEFQMRGSPHSHGLYWIQNAPQYDESNPLSHIAVIEFIDKFITCKRDEDGEMENLLSYQLHKHTHTCHKKSKNNTNCRFGFPKPPLPETLILSPLPNDMPSELRKNAELDYAAIQNELTKLGRSYKDDILFDDFLASLDMTKEKYIIAIRSSIKRNSVFLKRSTNAAFINGYNREMLLTWRANMDMQYVLDTYACAKYCAGYVLKAEGGVSKLLRAAIQEVKRGNLEIRERLFRYASVLQNGTEISAQEAAAFLLSLPFSNCSRREVYVNTSLPEGRVKILKSSDEINKLQPTSCDIFAKGVIEHYQQRPVIMENVCLAEFATLYEFTTRKRKMKQEIDATDCMLLDSTGYVYKRNRHKILRFRHYSKHNEETNYWREQLMLFVPWRNEQLDFPSDTNFKLEAEANISLITFNSQPYYFNRNMDEILLNDYVYEVQDEDENSNVPMHDHDKNEDDAVNLSGRDASKVEKFLPPKLIDNQQYYSIMRSLNDEQRRFVLHILNSIKTSKQPFYYFLSGGAGVGKSHAITAIVQSILRLESKKRTEYPDQLSVLVCAPTGKAAFNVFGMTIHSAFHILPNQSYERIRLLNESDASSLRAKLCNLQLLVIDEISMVGAKQLHEINERLKQLFNTSQDFGGKSILAVGHLRQLPPVNSRYIFEDPIHIPLGSLFGNLLWGKFQLYELTEIMRQRGEMAFCKALNNMAEGQMEHEDVQLIRTREISESFQTPQHTIYLFPTNAECKTFNDLIHSKLNTQGIASIAYDKVEGMGSTAQIDKLLEEAKQWDHTKADGLPYNTHLKVEGIYFITTNVDVQDGLFNGATGILKQIDFDEAGKLKHVWVKFEQDLIGLRARQKTRMYQIQHNIPLSWVKISFFVKTLTRSGKKGSLKIVRKQLPLLAANAMTIHKSQGSSIESVVISVNNLKGKSARELLYVGCSRATSLQGLHILGKFKAPKAPTATDKVSAEMERLRRKPIMFDFPCYNEVKEFYNILYYQNVNGIRSKILDLNADTWVKGSSVLCFVEPKVHANENVKIDNFRLICRKNSINRNSEGVLIFSKNNSTSQPSYLVHRHNNSHLCVTHFKACEFNFFLIYKHPGFSIKNFLSILESSITNMNDHPIIILGDININLQNEDGKHFIDLMTKFKLKSLVNLIFSTHDTGSTIDCCFTNSENLKAFVYESYFSDHKPIVMLLPKE